MSFSRKFKVLTILLAVLASYPMAAAGKIRFAIGDERKIIDTKGKESEAKTGGKVREKDKIRTGIEAQVIVALPDGSIVSVEENSLVEFTNLNSANGVQTAMTDIKQGKVRFDAQKQKGNSKFQFKTGTATAAIRGTDGAVGVSKKGFSVFGLNSGSMDIEAQCGATGSIQSGEMMVVHATACQIFKLANQNAGSENVIEQVMNAIDNGNGEIDENTKKLLESLDKVIESVKAQGAKALNCKLPELADTISTNSISVKVTCDKAPKAFLVNGTTVAQNQAAIDISSDWDPNILGEKKFDFTCVDTIDVVSEAKKLNIPENIIPENQKFVPVNLSCGKIQTYYYNAAIDSANKANLEKKDSVATDGIEVNIVANTDEICNNGFITLNGAIIGAKFDASKNIRIEFSTGNKSKQMSIPASENNFTYIFPIKDSEKNWEATKLEVSVQFPDESKKVATIALPVNKSCKAVNTIKPNVSIQTFSSNLQCQAKFKVINNENDEALISIYRDGDLIKEMTASGNDDGIFNLSSGTHPYKVVVTDQAKNEGSATKTLTCYDKNASAYVSINGSRKAFDESKRIPKAPPQFDSKLHKTLKIKINNMEHRDYTQIESITVTQEGKLGNIFFLTNANGDIDALDFSVPVDVEYGKKTTFKVKVKLYNGRVLENSAVFFYNDSTSEAH